MIFGPKRKGPRENRSKWHQWFAWRPVRLIDGRWIWLERCERAGYFLHEVEPNVPFTIFGTWVFRPTR